MNSCVSSHLFDPAKTNTQLLSAVSPNLLQSHLHCQISFTFPVKVSLRIPFQQQSCQFSLSRRHSVTWQEWLMTATNKCICSEVGRCYGDKQMQQQWSKSREDGCTAPAGRSARHRWCLDSSTAATATLGSATHSGWMKEKERAGRDGSIWSELRPVILAVWWEGFWEESWSQHKEKIFSKQTIYIIEEHWRLRQEKKRGGKETKSRIFSSSSFAVLGLATSEETCKTVQFIQRLLSNLTNNSVFCGTLTTRREFGENFQRLHHFFPP